MMAFVSAWIVRTHYEMTYLVAMFLPRWRAIESAGQDAFVNDENTAHESPVTRTAFGYGIGNLHKIGVPVWAHDLPPRKVKVQYIG